MSSFSGRITRQSVFHRSWLNTRHTAEAYAKSPAKQRSETEPFKSLGLEVPFIQALQRAYPRIKTPTNVQTQLIPAILGKQDILLQDVTGAGKSFGLVLGLINKLRLVSRAKKDGKEIERHRITTILLVRHRTLAFQLYRWIEQITKTLPGTRIESLAYVLVRGTGVPMKTQMKRLEEKPPHILICTPQALMDAYGEKREALKLATLSTIVLDEVDHRSYKLAYEKGTRTVPRYPGPTRQFLDIMYAKWKWNQRRYASERSGWQERGTVGRVWKQAPQLILSSATLGKNLKNYLFESGWLNKDNMVEILRDGERKKNEGKKIDKTEPTGKQGTVLHSVLVDQEYEKTL